MSSKSFHVVALGGIVLVLVSWFALPWITLNKFSALTGIGMLGLDGGFTYSIAVLVLTTLAAILTIVSIVRPSRAVRLAAVISGLLIALPLLPLYSEFADSTFGDSRNLFAIGFYATAIGALIVAAGNALSLFRKPG